MRFMQRIFRWFVAVALACLAGSVVAGAARAQDDYPNHAVRWLVGYPPGGATDIVARLLGQYLSEALHQQFIIENKPGAGNNLATETAVNSPPDGYTLYLVNPANAITLGTRMKPATGAISRRKLNERFLYSVALMALAGLTRYKV